MGLPLANHMRRLGDADDAGTPAWAAHSGPYLVLRAVLMWCEEPDTPQTLDMQFLDAAARYSGAGPRPSGALVEGITIAMLAGNLPGVVSPIAEYALAMIEEGNYDLASESLEVLTNNVLPQLTSDVVPAAARARVLLLALRSAVEAADWESADAAYTAAQEYAGTMDSDSYRADMLSWRWIGEVYRGNLGIAFAELTNLASWAKEVGAHAARARIHRAIGGVHSRRGEWSAALEQLTRSYALALDNRSRDATLVDLAAALAESGHLAVAAAVYTTLVDVADAEYVRSVAVVNLLELSVWIGDRPAVDRHYAQLQQMRPPAEAAAYGRLYHARGIERWDGATAAAAAYEDVARYATQRRLHHVAAKAEAELARVQADTPAPTPTIIELNTLEPSIRDLCEHRRAVAAA